MMLRIDSNIVMVGASSRLMLAPKGYGFITVLNPTAYSLTVYNGSGSDVSNRIMFVPAYTNLSVPLPNQGNNDLSLNVTWTGSSAADQAIVIFADEDLKVNASLAPGGGGAVSLIGDSVGLAKQVQLPAALTAGGNLKVEVMTSVAVTNMDATISSLISAVNALQIKSLQEQLTEAYAVVGVLTFAANISHIEIYNTDATNTGVFTVNGIAITVPPNKSFKDNVGGVAGATVTITGATTYLVGRYS